MPRQSPSSSPLPPPTFPLALLLRRTSYGIGCPFGQLGQLSRLCPLPASCAPPASLLAGWCEEQKRPGLCVSTAQRELKHPCVNSTVSSTNPRHSPIPATKKEINSIPAQTSAMYKSNPHIFQCWLQWLTADERSLWLFQRCLRSNLYIQPSLGPRGRG